MSDDHPVLAWARSRVTDDSDPTDALKERFLQMNDSQRVQELESLSGWLHDDTTLRKKAQLLRTARELNQVHLALRKAGR
jgi:hypothetical protein